MRYYEQGTPEWRAARCGKITASRLSDVMARGINGSEAQCRIDYKYQLASEIIIGEPQDNTFVNDAMRWGIENEPFARAAYEVDQGVMVETVGLYIHPRIERAAASPDGLVEFDGLIEIKCPQTATHLNTLLTEKIPQRYMHQMYWQMACTGRDWCDFVSFDPRLPEQYQLWIRRIPRDDKRIGTMEKTVEKFLKEVDDVVNRIQLKLGKFKEN